MSHKFSLTLLLFCLAFSGCSKSSDSTSANASPAVAETSANSPTPAAPGPVTAPAKPKLDACSLLTSADIQAVQGEAVKETKPSGQATGGLDMSQCFYSLPTFTNSISLLVAQKAEGSGATDPKQFFREHFQRDESGEKGKDKDRDKEKAGGRRKGESEEEEGGAPPEKVSGLGDDAYWTGTRVGGALYVLKGNTYLRISVGGASDQATKLKKSKALAAKALARLQNP